jgi:hypothetical protein
MKDTDIDQQIRNISWSKDQLVQEKAVNELMLIPELDLRKLIDLPPNYKEYMDNAAIILATFPFVRLENVIMDLYRWLMDLNWPGAKKIMELLKSFPKVETIKYFEKAVVEAIETHDESWLDNLSYFTMFEKYNRDDFQNKELYDLLSLHEKAMWRV